MDDKFQTAFPENLPEPEDTGDDGFQTAFPDPASVLTLKNPEGFQSAFEGKTALQPGEDGIIRCIHGCGKPAQFGDMKRSEFGHGQPGDPPRCEENMSDCPVVRRKAIHAAKLAGRLGRRWKSRF